MKKAAPPVYNRMLLKLIQRWLQVVVLVATGADSGKNCCCLADIYFPAQISFFDGD